MSKCAESAGSRAEVYNALAKCYYPPTQSLLHAVKGRANGNGPIAILGLVPDPEAELLDLEKDYAALFVGPFEILAPPYGSVYLEGENRVYGDSTLDAKRRYEEDGLTVALNEPPDHVAIELEYAYLMCFREAESRGEGMHGDADGCRDRLADFLRIHLARWIPAFAARVSSRAETGFYKQLASVTASHIHQEFTALSPSLIDGRVETNTP